MRVVSPDGSFSTDTQAAAGMSGSPVLSQNCRVEGILSSIYPELKQSPNAKPHPQGKLKITVELNSCIKFAPWDEEHMDFNLKHTDVTIYSGAGVTPIRNIAQDLDRMQSQSDQPASQAVPAQ